MKKHLITLAALALVACTPAKPDDGKTPDDKKPATEVPAYAKGADISWCTEMEAKNYKFYNANGFAEECTSLMKQIGFNAVRYRVWVNPTDKWCNKEDVLEKCKRAQALGLAIMIDFHYSDWWADPAQQNIPAQWKNYDVEQMTQAVADHTRDVLQTLKDNAIDVAWVQIGNETNTGMLSPMGDVSTSNKGAKFIKFSNAAYDVIKSIYPDALAILHHSNAQDLTKNQWFYNIMKNGGAKYDMIGLSLYPSYWDNSQGKFPDWTTATYKAVENFTTLHNAFGKPVMLVEFGMPASEADKAKDALQYVIDKTKGSSWFKGVFYWEPESEKSRNGYDYGAFAGGKPTIALDPFKD